MRARTAALLVLASSACATPALAPVAFSSPPAPESPSRVTDEHPPTLRLPAGVRPVAEAVELHLDPAKDRYDGRVDLDVEIDSPRQVVWLHGKGLHVTRATVSPAGQAPIDASWAEREGEYASLTLTRLAPKGPSRLHLEFDAAYGRGQHGLYKAREADVDYVFTQFEATAARLAFPCFDEPGFKIPFTTTLVVPAAMQAVANTREVARVPAEGGAVKVSFAPTVPLPSYLVAFAVGPLDVVAATDVPASGVRARPLPLRGIAPRGRGKEMAYALAHAGELVATLERYVGLEYPYDKLDLVAVPGKGGAMENAGLITFGERLLLLDGATAPVWQRRDYAGVVAHELAHMWTGDLVTMAWWDDTWLNEGFATWLGTKAAEAWDRSLRAELSQLDSTEGAMNLDSLVSARAVRQPIASSNDVENAFDAITYEKGAALLRMFERWVGPDVWQKGFRDYLVAHRFGSGTADEFLQAESEAAGKDVRTPFHSFLDQPGVPVLDASLSCAPGAASATLHLRQSRFLPLGSSGSATAESWQIPVCARLGDAVSCELLTGTEGDLPVPRSGGCPAFVLPNADGAGYYRFALPAQDLAALGANLGRLSEGERMVYADSLHASWSRGTTSTRDAVLAAEPLAADPEPDVAGRPMEYVEAAREWLWGTPGQARAEAYGRWLYGPVARRLGWATHHGEDDGARTLRGSVLSFLTRTARDPAVEAEARRLGLAYLGLGAKGAREATVHADAIDPELAGIALLAVGEAADRPTADALRALLGKATDEVLRGRLVRALASANDPALAAAGRELTLDPSLRDSEVLAPLSAQMSRPETREAAWAWVKEHYDALMVRVPRHHAGPRVMGLGRDFCDEEHARDIEAFFAKRVDAIEGGPRALATTVEGVRLCAARRKAQEASARDAFEPRPAPEVKGASPARSKKRPPPR